MARLKTKWNEKDRQRGSGQTGSVAAVNIWHTVCESLVNLENENFQTDTQLQRLDILAEACAFAVHTMDRLIYGHIDDDKRAGLIAAVAHRLAELIDDNRRDVGGESAQFIDLLNRRADEYAAYDFSEGPSFTMRRRFGEFVREHMGARDKKWVSDYVIDAEAPRIYSGVKRACAPLLGNARQPSAP